MPDNITVQDNHAAGRAPDGAPVELGSAVKAQLSSPTAVAVDRVVDAYVSRRVSRDVHAEIKPFVAQAVLAANPTTTASAKNLLRDVTGLAAWCLKVGLALENRVVFDPDTVERYIEERRRDASDAAVRAYRPNLRRVARAVAPELQPPRIPRDPRANSKAPYSPAEVGEYLRLAANQPSPLHRRRLLALLYLGLGAGLQPGEYQHVRPEHVAQTRSDVVVHVVGRHARVVPILAPYGEKLLGLVEQTNETFLLGGDPDGDRRNTVSRLLHNVRGGSRLPTLETGRLRATWLTHHIRSIGLDALLVATGIERSHTIFDLVAFLQEPSEARVSQVLRGEP